MIPPENRRRVRAHRLTGMREVTLTARGVQRIWARDRHNHRIYTDQKSGERLTSCHARFAIWRKAHLSPPIRVADMHMRNL